MGNRPFHLQSKKRVEKRDLRSEAGRFSSLLPGTWHLAV